MSELRQDMKDALWFSLASAAGAFVLGYLGANALNKADAVALAESGVVEVEDSHQLSPLEAGELLGGVTLAATPAVFGAVYARHLRHSGRTRSA